MVWKLLKDNYWLSVVLLFAVLTVQPLTTYNMASVVDHDVANNKTANQQILPGNSYKADVFVRGPVKGTEGERVDLTLTFTEMGDVSQLGSAVILLPDLHGKDGFNNYRINAEDSKASVEKRWKVRLVEQNGRHYINLRARSESDYLNKGESVSVTFSAETPTGKREGAYEFQTKAWTDNRSRDSLRKDPQTGQAENVNKMASGYIDPVVHVEPLEKTGSKSYQFSTERAAGLRSEVQAVGTGFDTVVFSTTSSTAFLTILQMPAVHKFTTTYYQPSGDDSWDRKVLVDGKTTDLLQGYAAGWQSYYHRAASPGISETYTSLTSMLKDQEELQDHDLSGLGESELKELAHQEGIDYYYTKLTAQTEQVWFAAVVLDPGEKGVLVKDIDCSYGITDYIFNEDGDLWSERRGYRGPDEGFGFVRDGDGYQVERGIDYPGSYIDLDQVADASKGKVIRYIDVSSPYSNSFLREDMIVSGSGRVDEILGNVNIEPGRFIDWPGSASFSDDWDLWVFPEGSSRSQSFDSPFFDTDSGGNGGIGGRSDSSTGPSTDSTARDNSGQELDDSDQVASSSTTSEDQEDEIVLPPGNSVAEGTGKDGSDMGEFDPANEYVLDFAVQAEQETNYSTIITISVVMLLLALTVLVILVALIRGAHV
ncbi:MAG: hypothetical protein ACQES4_07775 [Bacillota bacterium]